MIHIFNNKTFRVAVLAGSILFTQNVFADYSAYCIDFEKESYVVKSPYYKKSIIDNDRYFKIKNNSQVKIIQAATVEKLTSMCSHGLLVRQYKEKVLNDGQIINGKKISKGFYIKNPDFYLPTQEAIFKNDGDLDRLLSNNPKSVNNSNEVIILDIAQ